MRCALLLPCLFALAGCRCGVPLVRVEPARVVANPVPLVFPATWVGQSSSAEIELTNQGGAAATMEVSVGEPFATATNSLELQRGEAERLTLTFSPLSVGRFMGTLKVGERELPVEGEGLEVPQCMASSVCQDAHFDFSLAQCVDATSADGTSCETSCVSGACEAGACVGALKFCDDDNVCTLDACGDAQGCSHSDVVCPAPTALCEVPTCDPQTGCGTTEAPDGTLCGPDDCLGTTVDVCIAGSCVTRPRPATGRCTNRWVPASVPARFNHALTYDLARQRVVLFGGHASTSSSLGDTWEWDGRSWEQILPASSPPPRESAAMTWDASRQRTVLFGGWTAQGTTLRSDTWEWDGRSWTQAPTTQGPPGRLSAAMAYDSARHVAVLFGGYTGQGLLADTWAWDGAQWKQILTAVAPPARHGHTIAYDSARERIVLFGGRDASMRALADTWEWDGRSWTEVHPPTSPQGRTVHAMAYDARRRQVVLFGGMATNPLGDTWLWNGRTWTPVSGSQPQTQQGAAMAYDVAQERVVLFGGLYLQSYSAGTWLWDGVQWTRAAGTTPGPAARNTPRSQRRATTSCSSAARWALGATHRTTPGPGTPRASGRS